MKKLTLGLILLGVLVFPVAAFALDANTPPTDAISLTGLITSIGSIMWTVFGVIALIMFVVAGILFLTAGGAPDKIATARSAFIWGVAGVVVAIIAYSILTIVGSGLGI